MPAVSVVVPVYNVKELLPLCLDSIAAQTFADFECILVDDGSTDGSAEVCDAYVAKDGRFRVIHKANGGVCSARNAGVAAAAADYLVFCDQDDQFHPEALACALELQRMYPGDFIAWAFTQDRSVWDAPPSLEGVESFSSAELARFYMGHYSCGPGGRCCNLMDTFVWNKLFPTAFLREEGLQFDPSYKHGMEDATFMFQFWEKFFARYPGALMRWCPYPFYFWNDDNTKSVTKQKDERLSRIDRQCTLYDIAFVPLRDNFPTPPKALASLGLLLTRQFCLAFNDGPDAGTDGLWDRPQFIELMEYFRTNRYYHVYPWVLSMRCKPLCRLVCNSYDRSQWWYWKLYRIGWLLHRRSWEWL